jgi:hypothetical protein
VIRRRESGLIPQEDAKIIHGDDALGEQRA